MELGLSGFRVDAVPFLLETTGQTDADALPDPHDYLADLRALPATGATARACCSARSTCPTPT